jgi:hypothetical protein
MRDELGDRFIAGAVFHTGPHAFPLGERITALPISAIWAVLSRDLLSPADSSGQSRAAIRSMSSSIMP